MKRFFLSVIVLLLTTAGGYSCLGQNQNVWSSIADWSSYIPWSTFGTIEAYACYDIDKDGIAEAIVRGDDEGTKTYAVFACDPQRGVEGIEMVSNNLQKDAFGILADAPFIYVYKDNGDGYEYQQYAKIEQSRVEGFYSLTMQTQEGNTTYSYSSIKDGRVVEGFDKQQYEATVPALIGEVVDMEQLEWIKL